MNGDGRETNGQSLLTNFLKVWQVNMIESCYSRLISAASDTVYLGHEVVLVPLAAAVHEQFAPSLNSESVNLLCGDSNRKLEIGTGN